MRAAVSRKSPPPRATSGTSRTTPKTLHILFYGVHVCFFRGCYAALRPFPHLPDKVRFTKLLLLHTASPAPFPRVTGFRFVALEGLVQEVKKGVMMGSCRRARRPGRQVLRGIPPVCVPALARHMHVMAAYEPTTTTNWIPIKMALLALIARPRNACAVRTRYTRYPVLHSKVPAV